MPMKYFTFRGGVHPLEHKDYAGNSPLTEYRPTGEMVYPLSQHIGKPASAIVQKGDRVLVGQKIAESDGFVSAPVHASCSGTVKTVEERRVIGGRTVPAIVVDNDGQYEKIEGFGEKRDSSALKSEEILSIIKDSGIVGLGGAAFPTHVKLSPKNPEAIDHVIANGAECEPYITCDDQLMQRHAAEIIKGMEIILRLFPNARGVILIEENKPKAIQAMQEAAGSSGIDIAVAKTKYPQGGERSVIKAITGRDMEGKMLPADAGCIVDNVGTVYAIEEAVCKNIPLVCRAVTVTGDCVVSPSNLIVPLGTSATELLEAAGGIRTDKTPVKVLAGGPMMGIAMDSFDVPFIKGNNALTVLSFDENEEALRKMTNCIRCGRCNRVCPLGLIPQMMQTAAEKKDYETYAGRLHGLDCIACGSCTFVCPAKRPLMQLFKMTKAEILMKQRTETAKAKEAAS